MKKYVKSVEGRWGTCYYIKDDEYVGKSIKNYGEYNPDETEAILALAHSVGKDKLILDIGANIGTITQALLTEGFSVETFEPQKEVFDILVANCKGSKNHNVAVGGYCGEVIVPRVDYHKRFNFGSIGVSTEGEGDKVLLVTVDSITFDKPIGLMKIDVEGFEEQVLRGAHGTIMKDRPKIYLEADRKDTLDSLANYLYDVLHYDFREHRPTLYREKNFFNKKKNVWDKNYASYNWECVPQ